MKILLLQTVEYLYSMGGASKANRILLESLVQRGHECSVITPLMGHDGYTDHLYKSAKEYNMKKDNDDSVYFRKNDVHVYVAIKEFYIFRLIKNVSNEFKPDIIIITEDITGLLTETALETGAKVVYISHSQASLPFGPECYEPDPNQLRLYKKLDGIIVVSKYLKDYIYEWGGLDSELIYFPSYGTGSFPKLGNFDNKYVTVINPSGLKGIEIFLKLAQSLPEVSFAAVPTWGTSATDLAKIKALPNITVLKPEADIDNIFRYTKVFLMPSLWGESFGQVVVEAMLRGVPAIASHVGGLPEAKMGLDYILPVRPIEKYEKEQSLVSQIPRPIIPEQDVAPWLEALKILLNDRSHYEQLSKISREKTCAFVENLGIEPFEEYFLNLLAEGGSKGRESEKRQESEKDKKDKLLLQISKLPPEKREKLLTTLKGKVKQNG
jgi:glycosyltransferase involved in cell wall biosynthesis